MPSPSQTHTIDLNRTEKHILSIRLIPDGFSFSIHDPLSEGSFYYQEEHFEKGMIYEEAFQQAVFRNEALLKSYRKVYLLFSGMPFTLVPDGFSSQEELLSYYDFVYPHHQEKVILNRLPQNKAVLLFGLSNALYSFIRRTFPEAVLVHSLGVLSEYFIQKQRGEYGRIFAQYTAGRLDIVCLNSHGLQLLNSFAAPTVEDAAYYLLQIFEQLSLDRERDEVLYYTLAEQSEALQKRLSGYLPLLKLVHLPGRVYELGRETLAAPFDLIAITLCEL